MTYTEALSYIHSVCWKGSRPGLERITKLCRRLGDPQKKLKFIHVTGTNGKGSTCAMVESVLRAAGYKTGLFTSPYVKFFNERMQVNGKNVSDERLAYVTSLVKPHADAMADAPTEFELITAIALVLFTLEECEIVVLEAGMGGRLDSTNVIEQSVLSVITGVALEHTEFLGDTIEKIAYEKANIIKKGCPVVYGGLDTKVEGDAYRVIRNHAAAMGSPLFCTDYDALTVKEASLDGTLLDYKAFKDIRLSLLGLYQPQNCAKALEILKVLQQLGYKIDEDAIRKGLASTVWRARFEKLMEKPLVLYDGAHNPDGVRVATATLAHYFGEQKVNILTGVMADKDYPAMVSMLAPHVAKAFTVTPDNPRSLNAQSLKEVFLEHGVAAEAFTSLPDAVKTAIDESHASDVPLVCLGSLYMYAEITDAMGM
ncbi:MAG: bifunctional folylpolyglutamate synthase/dihydrofolate synthase [Ruminococcaceae bacterium]|nr:bifunctional folylpolyglutamate synthase/dihydrofolate synthase [Oscillospiraceae bacterium]